MNAASLMLRSEANQKEVDELHKRLAVLTEDISHKQTLIDRLLKEVDKRSDAIRTCGVEIVQLRRKNKKLNTDKDEMEKQMKAMVEAEKREAAAISEATEQELTNGGELNGRELAQRLHIMQEKYKTEKETQLDIFLPRVVMSALLKKKNFRDSRALTYQVSSLPRRPHLDLLGKQLVRQVLSVA